MTLSSTLLSAQGVGLMFRAKGRNGTGPKSIQGNHIESQFVQPRHSITDKSTLPVFSRINAMSLSTLLVREWMFHITKEDNYGLYLRFLFWSICPFGSAASFTGLFRFSVQKKPGWLMLRGFPNELSKKN